MEKEAGANKPSNEGTELCQKDGELGADSNEQIEEREQEKSKTFSKLIKMLSFNKRD